MPARGACSETTWVSFFGEVSLRLRFRLGLLNLDYSQVRDIDALIGDDEPTRR